MRLRETFKIKPAQLELLKETRKLSLDKETSCTQIKIQKKRQTVSMDLGQRKRIVLVANEI
jgi:hypothetical protein